MNTLKGILLMAMVWINSSALLTYDEVLQNLNLHDGQTVTEEQKWRVIEGNAQYMIDQIEAKRSAGEPNLPDTSQLQRDLNQIYRKRN